MRATNILLPLVLGLAVGFISGCIGFPAILHFSPIPSLVCLGLLLILFAISLLMRRSYVRRMEAIQAAQIRKDMVQELETVAQDYASYQQQFDRDRKLFLGWVILCSALCVVMIILAGAAILSNAYLATLPFLVGVYVLTGLCFWAFAISKEKISQELILSRTDYPTLYALADQIFDHEKKPPVFLWTGGNSISVFRIGGVVHLALGSYALPILNEEELKNILLHEYGHMQEDRSDPQRKVSQLLDQHPLPSQCNLLLLPVDYLLAGPMLLLNQRMMQSEAATSVVKEQRADAYAMSRGNPAAMLSGLTKLQMMDLYINYEVSQQIDYYARETCPKDVTAQELENFCRVFQEKKDFWMELLLHQLPPQVGSHPTLPQRIEALGNPEFQVSLTISDPAYATEQDKFVALADRLIYDDLHTDYEQAHQKNWVIPWQTIHQFEAEEADGTVHTPLEMRPVLGACNTVGAYDKLETYCSLAIQRAEGDHDAAHAHFLLGRYLLCRYNPDGIDHLYAAADTNNNYCDEAFNLIGSFCLLMGLKDRLEEYRAHNDTVLQRQWDQNELDTESISKKDQLSVETQLPQARREENIDFILSCGKDVLRGLYQVHKQLSANYFSTVYILDFQEGTTPEQMDAVHQKVFEYLDTLQEQYTLLDSDDLGGIKLSDLAPMRVYPQHNQA